MSQDFSTTALLASIKRRGMIPTTDEALSTSDFLAIATEELQSYITELLVSVREEYGISDYDQTTTVGEDTYGLPPRAAGDSLRQVLLSDGAGNYYPLSRIEPNRRYDYSSSGEPSGFVVEDHSVILVPSPSTATTLRMKYFRQASALVVTSAVATVSSINGARTVVTTSSTIPATFTSGVSLDVVDNLPGFRCLTIDAATTGTVSGTTITFSSALPDTVTAGDYVCLAGESPVPQIPVSLHPLLAQRTAQKCLEALGDKRSRDAKEICDEMRRSAITLLTPRTQGNNRVIVNHNAPGWSRRIRRRF